MRPVLVVVDVDGVVSPVHGTTRWADDDLRHGARAAACRRRLGALDVEVLLVAPRTEFGVTPEEMSSVDEWVASRVARREAGQAPA